jgi:uncharacterized protein (UPF0276 family)
VSSTGISALLHEHLSYQRSWASVRLLPIPFTERRHDTADRIRQTQDILGRQIGIEHVLLRRTRQVLTELDFNRVLELADCSTSTTSTSTA